MADVDSKPPQDGQMWDASGRATNMAFEAMSMESPRLDAAFKSLLAKGYTVRAIELALIHEIHEIATMHVLMASRAKER